MTPSSKIPLRIVELAAKAAQTDIFRFRDSRADPFARSERITVLDAFRIHAGIDLLKAFGSDGTPDRATLARESRERRHQRSRPMTPGPTFSAAYWWNESNRISASANPRFSTNIRAAKQRWRAACRHDPRFAERFELFCLRRRVGERIWRIDRCG